MGAGLGWKNTASAEDAPTPDHVLLVARSESEVIAAKTARESEA